MAQPDAPILIHASQIPRMWRWGVDFIRCSRPGPSWQNTRRVVRLAMFSLEALKEIRADTGVQYDAVQGARSSSIRIRGAWTSFDGARDPGGIGRAGALAPPDQAVVRDHLDDHVGHAIPGDQRADLGPYG
jgi:hypothetical protein